MNKADFEATSKIYNKIAWWILMIMEDDKEHLKLMLGNRIFLSLFTGIYIEDVNNGVVQFSCNADYKREKYYEIIELH